MKQHTIENQTEVYITAENLEVANLNEWERLELHLLDQAAVVIPGNMTVMELICVTEALQGLASDLLSVVEKVCDHCDNCQMDEPCKLMCGTILPQVSIPACVLEEAGLGPNCKLACTAGHGSSEVRVTEAEHRYDLTDLRPDLLKLFRECGVCLGDLEDKLIQDTIVYS